jgi:hypothetical protein
LRQVGIHLGKLIQNTFTSAKTLSLFALIVLGILVGRNAGAIAANFTDLWTPHDVTTIKPDLPLAAPIAATAGAFGLFIAFCVAQVGSLFSSDAWNNITFAAAEVYSTDGFGQNRDAQRGTGMGQYEGRLGANGSYRLTGTAYSTHFHSAGVIREEVNNGYHNFAGEAFLTWADFLLGLDAEGNGTAPFASLSLASSNIFFSLDSPGLFGRAYRVWETNAYIQDDFKLNARLTLNLGFRFDRLGDISDALGRNGSLDSSLLAPRARVNQHRPPCQPSDCVHRSLRHSSC